MLWVCVLGTHSTKGLSAAIQGSSWVLVSFSSPVMLWSFGNCFSPSPWLLPLNISKLSLLLLGKRLLLGEQGSTEGSWGLMGSTLQGPVQSPRCPRIPETTAPEQRRSTGSCGQHPKVQERRGTRSGCSAQKPLQSPSNSSCWLHPALAQKCFNHTQLTPGWPKKASLGG